MKLILASKSPRRKELLSKAGFEYTIESKNTKEVIDDSLTVYQNVMNVSLEKALAVFENNKDSVVLGCDTIVVFENKIYGKPKDKEDAFLTLKKLSGNTHKVISGVAVITPNKRIQYYCESFVTFKKLSDKEILDYIETNEPMDKAGSYAIQGLGAKLIDHYTGSFNNIVGLPIEEVSKTLKEVL
jgi:septum formation protein